MCRDRRVAVRAACRCLWHVKHRGPGYLAARLVLPQSLQTRFFLPAVTTEGPEQHRPDCGPDDRQQAPHPEHYEHSADDLCYLPVQNHLSSSSNIIASPMIRPTIPDSITIAASDGSSTTTARCAPPIGAIRHHTVPPPEIHQELRVRPWLRVEPVDSGSLFQLLPSLSGLVIRHHQLPSDPLTGLNLVQGFFRGQSFRGQSTPRSFSAPE